jgi:hypothetical protein
MQNLKQGTPDIIASIAAGFGGPYAGLVSSFSNVLKGQPYITDVPYQQQGETPPYYDQGQYGQQGGQPSYDQGQYGQQGSQPYYDQGGQPSYDQGQYGQQGGQPSYDQGQYGQQGSQPYYDQGGQPSYDQGQYGQQGGQPSYDQGQYGQQGGQPSYDQGQYGQQQGQYGQQGGQPSYDQGQYGQQGSQPYYDQGGQPSYDQGQYGQQAQPVSYSQNLAVEIDVLKEVNENGRFFAKPVKNGDTLTQQDNYKVQYFCNMQCYVYIAQLDSIGKLEPIIPSNFVAWSNPMAPNKLYSVPEANNWFFLDENKGVEQIFFIVSKTPRPDIEQLFRKISAENKNLKQLQPVTIDQPLYTTRGIKGVREGRQQNVTFQNGSQGRYDATLFESVQADFVVTRWFYHN